MTYMVSREVGKLGTILMLFTVCPNANPVPDSKINKSNFVQIFAIRIL